MDVFYNKLLYQDTEFIKEKATARYGNPGRKRETMFALRTGDQQLLRTERFYYPQNLPPKTN